MIDYDEHWITCLLFRATGSVALKAAFWAVPSAALSVILLYFDEWLPGMREDLGLTSIQNSQLWNAATVVAVLLLGFRTRQALARFWEGTSLLHQMRGEWFDTVSNCVSFSSTARSHKPKEVKEFRNVMVRLMSLAHGSALEEISCNEIQCESMDVFGLDRNTLRFIKECHEVYNFNKVEVILHIVQTLIVKAHEDGILKIPPPILSRVYQTISRGFVNLLNAKKINDTRFPFPYSQLICFLLVSLEFLVPIMLTAVIHSKVLVAVITFFPLFGLFSLNYIAAELENPFGIDPNDLPLSHFQHEMNSCLLMLLHGQSDLIAGLSPECMEFDEMFALYVDRSENYIRQHSSKRRFSEFDADVGQIQGQNESGGQTGEVEKSFAFLTRFSSLTSSAVVSKNSAIIRQTSPQGFKSEGSASGSSKSRFNLFDRRGLSFLDGLEEKMTMEIQSSQEEAISAYPSGSEMSSQQPNRWEIQTAGPMSPRGKPSVPLVLPEGETMSIRAETVDHFASSDLVKLQVTNSNPGEKQAGSAQIIELGAGAPAHLEPVLSRSLEEFNAALQTWTEMITVQVTDLTRNMSTLKRYSF